jgi:hypothetical protein
MTKTKGLKIVPGIRPNGSEFRDVTLDGELVGSIAVSKEGWIPGFGRTPQPTMDAALRLLLSREIKKRINEIERLQCAYAEYLAEQPR